MVKEKTTEKFECEYCRKEYDYKRDAEECEERHNQKKEIENIERAKKFTITDNHLKLIRSMYVDWDDCEYGAPCINPKRPYGNSNVEDDIAEMIKFPKKGNWDKEEEMWNEKASKELYHIHREMQIVLQICLCLGKFETGNFVKQEEYNSLSWKKSGETNQKGGELK